MKRAILATLVATIPAATAVAVLTILARAGGIL